MDKLKMQSNNLVDANVEKIARLFPNCVTEAIEAGNLTKKVDFDLLRQELSTILIEGKDERYRLDWAGKRQAILTANSPIAKTLRPCREESVNFDKTENLYIEGDNLDVLKLLHETYLSKIKMIYIDPPYNTGNDFVYEDDFAIDSEEYLAMSNQKDDQGNRMSTNKETSGRFHSDWLSMMYMRLKLTRDLLAEDGAIFISIDDNEQANLKRICDEVFGEEQFIAQCVRKRRDSQANLSKNISPIHEYILIYAKQFGEIFNRVPANINENDFKNPDNDPRGPYVTMPCTNKGGAIYTVTTPTGIKITEEWRFKKETYDVLFMNNKIVFPRGGDGKPRYKLFLSEKKENGVLPNTWLDGISSNQVATKEVKEIFSELVFETPKPIGLIKFCLSLITNKESIVLDFFSGSGTTAHSVMQLNAEDGGNRKFIMVQMPELTDEKSEAYKAGYKNICEIGKERIRRAGNKILEKNRMTAPNLDIGFRVLKLADSNMKEVFYNPHQYNQSMLLGLDSSIKEDRTAEDILFQVMLDKGISLSSKIQKKTTTNGQQTFYIVGETGFGIIDLICCLDKKVNTEAVKEIAKLGPECCVFLDSGIENDATRTNIQQIFDTYSTKTKVEVL